MRRSKLAISFSLCVALCGYALPLAWHQLPGGVRSDIAECISNLAGLVGVVCIFLAELVPLFCGLLAVPLSIAVFRDVRDFIAKVAPPTSEKPQGRVREEPKRKRVSREYMASLGKNLELADREMEQVLRIVSGGLITDDEYFFMIARCTNSRDGVVDWKAATVMLVSHLAHRAE